MYIPKHLRETMKLLIILLLLCSNAFASQCESVSLDQATKALNILNKFNASKSIFVIDEYCEACLDYIPKPILVNSIKLVKDKRSHKASIEINKSKIDMAYIFVEGDNLAKKIGCKTYAVSSYLN